MTRCASLWLIIPVLILASCGDDRRTVDPPASFVVRLEVLDVDSAVVPNLRVSAWNHLDSVAIGRSGGPYGSTQNLMTPMATTEITFMLTERSDYTLTFSRLNHDELDKFSGISPAGYSAIDWSTGDLHSGAYRYKLVAVSSESDDTVLNDTKIAYLHNASYLTDSIGFTDSTGVFETTYRPDFPSTYDLGPQPRMSYMGELVGTFEILDTVRFVLTDTGTGLSMYFDSVVTSGQNVFNITWAPVIFKSSSMTNPESSTAQRASGKDVKEGMSTGNAESANPGQIPTESSLEQNFPNPFN